MSRRSRAGQTVILRSRRWRFLRSAPDTPIWASTLSCSMWICWSLLTLMVCAVSAGSLLIENFRFGELFRELLPVNLVFTKWKQDFVQREIAFFSAKLG